MLERLLPITPVNFGRSNIEFSIAIILVVYWLQRLDNYKTLYLALGVFEMTQKNNHGKMCMRPTFSMHFKNVKMMKIL